MENRLVSIEMNPIQASHVPGTFSETKTYAIYDRVSQPCQRFEKRRAGSVKLTG